MRPKIELTQTRGNSRVEITAATNFHDFLNNPEIWLTQKGYVTN